MRKLTYNFVKIIWCNRWKNIDIQIIIQIEQNDFVMANQYLHLLLILSFGRNDKSETMKQHTVNSY